MIHASVAARLSGRRPWDQNSTLRLLSGTFTTQGRRVLGHWPIERSFVENVLNGGA
jgi:hypothetical protein